MTAPTEVLAVKDLNVAFSAKHTRLPAIIDLSFSLSRGETLAIVGESGCGKSLTALSLLGLLPPQARILGGSVQLDGKELTGLGEEQFRRLRGNRISIIFQEAMTALNPVLCIGEQLAEAVLEHEPVGRSAARARAISLLERVRIPDAARRFKDYPHQLSGGMRQRVVIAMAIALSPAVLVADEPTTALDVTVQAEILGLIGELQSEHGTGVILITHDIGLVAEYADRVLVMYAGRKIEEQKASHLIKHPLHPYTQALIAARPNARAIRSRRLRLAEIPGMVPPLGQLPQGCAFAPRCPYVLDACRAAVPELFAVGSNGYAACIRAGDIHAETDHARLSTV